MKEKIEDIIVIIISCLAILMVVATLIVMNNRHNSMTRTCEELTEEKGKSSGYIPLPKQCEGEK